MKIRFAVKDDLEDIIRLSKLMPNIALTTNENFIRDSLEKIMQRNYVCTVAEEDGKMIGMIFFVHDKSFDDIIGFKMFLKFLLRRYGPLLKLVRKYPSSHKMRELIRDSYHGFMIAIESKYRKKGVATRLWKAAAEKMSGKVTFLIDSENRESNSYVKRRIGAEKVKEIPELFEKGKTWFLYVKFL